MNSFTFMSRAIEYEAERQIDLLESGGSVRQGNAGAISRIKNRTEPMQRERGCTPDYRYFRDPRFLVAIRHAGASGEAQAAASRVAGGKAPTVISIRLDYHKQMHSSW